MEVDVLREHSKAHLPFHLHTHGLASLCPVVTQTQCCQVTTMASTDKQASMNPGLLMGKARRSTKLSTVSYTKHRMLTSRHPPDTGCPSAFSSALEI